MSPHSTGGVSVNFLGEEGQERVRAAYGPEKYARVAGLKAKYDPENVFHTNQNVAPVLGGDSPPPAVEQSPPAQPPLLLRGDSPLPPSSKARRHNPPAPHRPLGRISRGAISSNPP
jgi:hypothetical protein